jgi:hypothetical protein
MVAASLHTLLRISILSSWIPIILVLDSKRFRWNGLGAILAVPALGSAAHSASEEQQSCICASPDSYAEDVAV